jgi:hypothetical protein
LTSNISLRLDSDSARPDPGRQRGPSPAPAASGDHQQLDGRTLKTMIAAGYAWLEHHKEIVNALNVFPVPDGDTGTNMFLTMRAAWREIGHSDDDDVSHIAQAMAQGALMGARGNSGVILSQILRGMAHTFRHKPVITAHDLALGLRQGSETAYKGVVKPVEGTILTVIRQAADAAQKAAAVEDDLDFVLAHTVQAAGEAVEQTPSLLPVLARAGVVDSGGKGLYLQIKRGNPWRVYKLTSHGDNVSEKAIFALGGRVDHLEAKTPEQTADATGETLDGVQVTHNTEKDGVEIRFPSRPSDETLDALKAEGFRWSRFAKVWYAKYSDETMEAAKRICG